MPRTNTRRRPDKKVPRKISKINKYITRCLMGADDVYISTGAFMQAYEDYYNDRAKYILEAYKAYRLMIHLSEEELNEIKNTQLSDPDDGTSLSEKHLKKLYVNNKINPSALLISIIRSTVGRDDELPDVMAIIQYAYLSKMSLKELDKWLEDFAFPSSDGSELIEHDDHIFTIRKQFENKFPEHYQKYNKLKGKLFSPNRMKSYT